MRRIGIQEDGPTVVAIDDANEARVCTPKVDLSPGAVGSRGWQRYVDNVHSCDGAFHGIFVRATADRVASLIASKWTARYEMWWQDIGEKAMFIDDHHSGQSMLPDTALVIELRSWPWTIVTGTVNAEASGGFCDGVGVIARHFHSQLRTDVVAVSNNGSLELSSSSNEVFVKTPQDDWGVTSEWLEERGLFIPPFFVDSPGGFLRIRFVGIPREEIVRIDLFRNLDPVAP